MARHTRHPFRPYKPLTMDAKDFERGLSLTDVLTFIEKHESRNYRRYKYLEGLYAGFYDIYREPENEAWKPDNRLVVTFAREITDTFCGYAYGLGIGETSEDEKLNDAIQVFRADNEIKDHELELAKYFCECGHAFEYFYQDEQARTKVVAVRPTEMFIVYDKAIKRRALFAVRYGHIEEDDGGDIIKGEILTRDYIKTFEDTNVLEVRDNPYGLIPCVEYIMNEERIGIYEGVAALIESYNHTISEKANDVDAFAEAYLAVLGAELDEDGLYHIRDNRIINLYGTDNAKDIVVQFLQKPTADDTQEHLLDRLEKQIYQKSMVVNLADDTFRSTESGVAMAYKMEQMANLAVFTNGKMRKSIMKRYKIFCSLATNSATPEGWKTVQVDFTPNTPHNITEEIQAARDVEGIVSKETQLKLLHFVEDPKAEQERMEQEQRALFTDSQALREVFGVTTNAGTEG